MKVHLTKNTNFTLHANEGHLLNQFDFVGGLPEYKPLILEASIDPFETVEYDSNK